MQQSADTGEGASTAEGEEKDPGQVPDQAVASKQQDDQEASAQANGSEDREGGTTPEVEEAKVEVGEKVSGVLTRIGADDSFVDFGGAVEGRIASTELRDPDTGAMGFDTGDPLEAYVTALDEGATGVALSRVQPESACDAGAVDRLYTAYKAGTPVKGQVVAVNKWGLGVDIDGIRAFCPVALIDVGFVKDTSPYRDQELEFKITRFKDEGRTVVVSRRALLQAEQGKEAEAVRADIKVGAKLEGKVTRIQPYGAFVDLGAGVEGLIHVSEFKHERVEHPQDVVEKDAEVTVAVIRVQNLGNSKGERISLSLKALLEDPWSKVREQFSPGSVVDGTVQSLEEYGAIVALTGDVQGMVHVSEIAEKRIAHPREVLSIGEHVRVAVLEVDRRRRRLRLSLRRAEQMEDAANLREFQQRDREESQSSDLHNALTDALQRARLV